MIHDLCYTTLLIGSLLAHSTQAFEKVKEPHLPIILRDNKSSGDVQIRLTKTGPIELLSEEVIHAVANGDLFKAHKIAQDATADLQHATVQPIFQGNELHRLIVT